MTSKNQQRYRSESAIQIIPNVKLHEESVLPSILRPNLRTRTVPEHRALLTALNQNPTDTTMLGAGYVLLPVEPEQDTTDVELTVRGVGHAKEDTEE